jgi:hypothetical protein
MIIRYRQILFHAGDTNRQKGELSGSQKIRRDVIDGGVKPVRGAQKADLLPHGPGADDYHFLNVPRLHPPAFIPALFPAAVLF